MWIIGTFPALKLNIDNYPAIKEYLQSFGKQIKQSGEKGNPAPYFSVTGAAYKVNRRGERDARFRDCLTGACIHATIIKALPDLSDVVALHLSDINGLPCYAVENGWYWVQEGNVGNLAGLLRISREKAEELMSISKEEFVEFVESQKPRWKYEAIAAIEKYNLAVR